MNERKCISCESTFREHGMIGDQCKKCHELHPDAKSKEDIKSEKKKEFIAELLSENVIQKMVYDILSEAGLKREKCECGKMYFKKSPAQKQCRDCSKK